MSASLEQQLRAALFCIFSHYLSEGNNWEPKALWKPRKSRLGQASPVSEMWPGQDRRSVLIKAPSSLFWARSVQMLSRIKASYDVLLFHHSAQPTVTRKRSKHGRAEGKSWELRGIQEQARLAGDINWHIIQQTLWEYRRFASPFPSFPHHIPPVTPPPWLLLQIPPPSCTRLLPVWFPWALTSVTGNLFLVLQQRQNL